MFTRTAIVLLALVVAGCSRFPEDGAANAARPAENVAVASATPSQSVYRPAQRLRSTGFASLPDRGNLVSYARNSVRQSGAYTSYRSEVSEEHALHAIASGRLRVTTPEGEVMDVQYDRHIEHPSGDWTWIGHLPGREGEQTILTFGARAVFGSIAQPGKLPLRLTVHDGASWMVETDPRKIASIDNAATRPKRPDYHVVPVSALARQGAGPEAVAGSGNRIAASSGQAQTAAAATAVVDVLIGYTPGFASALGGASAALTRIYNLVEITNAAYANSQINAQVRLVKAIEVNYTDTNSNDTALKELTGYDSEAEQEVPPAAAFNALRQARETYGADLVSLVRDFTTPENEGCGIAWLLGGNLQGIKPGVGWDQFGYSVVSDGVDLDESDSKNYFCRDETLAHELGHNMGAAHDKESAMGDDGTLDNPDDYGAYTYSFGYKTSAGNNFYTIMAYGDSGQTRYRTFSTPDTTFCGGQACGASDTDNARALNQTTPVVAGFRQSTMVSEKVRADFDGDGASDLLWRHASTGANTIWLSANKASQQQMTRVGNLAWKMVGIGDFDGDGQADVLWRNTSSGSNTIWRSGNSASVRSVVGVGNLAWKVVGTGDFDGDGRDDILWRNSTTGANTIWRSANSSTQQPMTTIKDLGWEVVGVGDFDQDGKSDIFWRHAKTGANVIWKSGDYATRQAVSRVANLYWQVRGVGDFDGDAIDDILWRNVSTGSNTIWLSANSATQQVVTRIGDLSWIMEAVGDYNGDGKADIMWRNAGSGANVLWPSASYSQQQILGRVTDLNWQVQPRLN